MNKLIQSITLFTVMELKKRITKTMQTMATLKTAHLIGKSFQRFCPMGGIESPSFGPFPRMIQALDIGTIGGNKVLLLFPFSVCGAVIHHKEKICKESAHLKGASNPF